MSTNLGLPEGPSEHALPPSTNEGLPSFLRATIATRIASQPRTWAKTYSFLTGIAGAKQWLIADYSQFKGTQPIPNGTVLLAETLPTLTRMGDVSNEVQANGFVQVHGTPHFRQIREIFGLPAKGPGAYEEHLSSALLDKASTISNLAISRQVLSDPLPPRTSSSTSVLQIPVSARNDISERPVPEGGLDAKVTSRCLVKGMTMQAISGPATNGDHPAFDWDSFGKWPHAGLPKTYNFNWLNIAETGSSPVDDAPAACSNPDIVGPVSSFDRQLVQLSTVSDIMR